MLLIIQVLIILILASTLISIYIDEIYGMKRRASHVAVEEIWFGRERRRFVRVKRVLDVTYSYNAKGKNTSTENISLGGAKIQLEEKLNKGSPLLLEIKLPDVTKPIVARSKIVWVDSTPRISSSGKRVFGAGVEFTHLGPTEKKKLSRFIKEELTSK